MMRYHIISHDTVRYDTYDMIRYDTAARYACAPPPPPSAQACGAGSGGRRGVCLGAPATRTRPPSAKRRHRPASPSLWRRPRQVADRGTRARSAWGGRAPPPRAGGARAQACGRLPLLLPLSPHRPPPPLGGSRPKGAGGASRRGGRSRRRRRRRRAGRADSADLLARDQSEPFSG